MWASIVFAFVAGLEASALLAMSLHPISRSEPAGRYPKSLPPLTTRGNTLQLFVHSGVRQVERVGDRRHRLETDEPLARWSVHNSHCVLRTIRHRHLLVLAVNGEFSSSVRARFQVAEHVV